MVLEAVYTSIGTVITDTLMLYGFVYLQNSNHDLILLVACIDGKFQQFEGGGIVCWLCSSVRLLVRLLVCACVHQIHVLSARNCISQHLEGFYFNLGTHVNTTWQVSDIGRIIALCFMFQKTVFVCPKLYLSKVLEFHFQT